MMSARRSRTGCATCRKRKLKCDEAKPVCGQCTKSRRECVPSDGVAFRHEQNAGLNSEIQGSRSLGNFYKYRNDYTQEQMKNFIPLPTNFEWRYVTDVYAEDAEQIPSRNAPSPQAYQREMASGGLEALSTAAAENQSYQPPVTYADINSLYQGGNAGYGPANGPNQNHNIKFLLNPSNTPAALIDPNLDTTTLEAGGEAVQLDMGEDGRSKDEKEGRNGESSHQATNEEHNLLLLKNYDEQTA